MPKDDPAVPLGGGPGGSDEDMFKALLLLAGIPVSKMHKLANKYWPENPYYADIAARHPWWLVMTPYGAIVMGWRKRVISINWEDTAVRAVLTDDDVTKSDTMVHAWSYGAALEYMTKLRYLLTAPPPSPLAPGPNEMNSLPSQSEQPTTRSQP